MRNSTAEGTLPALRDLEDLIGLRHPEELAQVRAEGTHLQPATGRIAHPREVRHDAEDGGGEGPDIAEIEQELRVLRSRRQAVGRLPRDNRLRGFPGSCHS